MRVLVVRHVCNVFVCNVFVCNVQGSSCYFAHQTVHNRTAPYGQTIYVRILTH